MTAPTIRALLVRALASVERVEHYAHTNGTVDTDNRDEARQCAAQIRDALERLPTGDVFATTSSGGPGIWEQV